MKTIIPTTSIAIVIQSITQGSCRQFGLQMVLLIPRVKAEAAVVCHYGIALALALHELG
jgi:hypothetical protein